MVGRKKANGGENIASEDGWKGVREWIPSAA